MDCDEDINFSKLHKELNIAMKEDEKYKRENAAKFRAVEQRVGSYEEFRDIVLASNLKPLERKDILGATTGIQRSWNSPLSTSSRSASQKQCLVTTEEARSREESCSIQTISEFNRCWRQCNTDEEKFKLLLRIGRRRTKDLFKQDVGSAPLGDIVNTLCKNLVQGEAGNITEILESLGDCNRLDIALAFLDKQERANLKILFDKLFEHGEAEKVVHLRTIFKS